MTDLSIKIMDDISIVGPNACIDLTMTGDDGTSLTMRMTPEFTEGLAASLLQVAKAAKEPRY